MSDGRARDSHNSNGGLHQDQRQILRGDREEGAGFVEAEEAAVKKWHSRHHHVGHGCIKVSLNQVTA